jgi:parallel beta-helix repeat protein
MARPFRPALRYAPQVLLSMLVLLGTVSACTSDLTETSLNSAATTQMAERRAVSKGLIITPDSAQVQLRKNISFKAATRSADGELVDVAVTWTASGGTITSDGVFTSNTAGTYSIVGKLRGRYKRSDTATVVVLSTPTTLAAVQIAPDSAVMAPGALRAFVAKGILSDGTLGPVGVAWTASGGTIDEGGTFRAGQQTGTYWVAATDPQSGLSDTAEVTISADAPRLRALVLTPSTANLTTGQTQAFSAVGILTDSSTATIPVRYSATGGTVTSLGRYTAGTVPGTYRVIATDSSGTLADTASVLITVPPPTLQAVVLTPASVNIQTGGTQQFAASGRLSDGSTAPVTVVFSATGGSISASGLFSAGQTAGTYRVVARQSGGTLADTAQVAISAPLPPPPPPSPSACAGVAVPAGTRIQDAVNASPTGTVFCLGAGTFAQQSVQPKAGQQFIGARGSNGERLSILDGQTTIRHAFTGSAGNVRIQGLVVRNYYGGTGTNTSDLSSAIFGFASTGWVVYDNEVHNNSGSGIHISSGSIIRKNHTHHNGWLGMHSGGGNVVGAVVDSNEISYNNTRGIDPNWGGAGLKAVLTTNFTLRGNWVHHNQGQGLWCDNCYATTYYLGNLVEDNTYTGIFHEVSAAAVIEGNTTRRNGTSNQRGGIWVDNSSNVEVRGNTVAGNGSGILLRMLSRPELPSRVLTNVYVHDNSVSLTSSQYAGLVQYVGANSYFSSANNRFVNNRWTLTGASSSPYRWNNSNLTESQWRAAGQDVNGTFTR